MLIETATEVCSAAVAVSGNVIAIEEMPDCLKHTAVLPLQIQRCLELAGMSPVDLDAIAISGGPGSYTTLRTGVSLAKGMCYALQKPLIAIDTLQALAWACREIRETPLESETLYMPMLDARRNEVWTALYDRHLQEVVARSPLILEHILFENYVKTYKNGDFYVICGNGTLKMPKMLFNKKTVGSCVLSCSARYLTVLAEEKFNRREFENLAGFEPFYMKDPNITTSVKFS